MSHKRNGKRTRSTFPPPQFEEVAEGAARRELFARLVQEGNTHEKPPEPLAGLVGAWQQGQLPPPPGTAQQEARVRFWV